MILFRELVPTRVSRYVRYPTYHFGIRPKLGAVVAWWSNGSRTARSLVPVCVRLESALDAYIPQRPDLFESRPPYRSD